MTFASRASSDCSAARFVAIVSRVVSTSRNTPAIIETAAATAPEAPAMTTAAVLDVVAATPKIRPKIDTVPSSIPNTMVPAELTSELRRRCQVAAMVIVGPLCHASAARALLDEIKGTTGERGKRRSVRS